ncbi:hypothetical protein L1987_84481 [Smallanthus sonchifolius]|uniref:Uncharacterized protein n=1 Tax=Smallanthus sonchifolius TaxID=185202 RepID=A0ACB8YE40_9ASTR|nr:hypothetical protein L1987_84481 [Smallanthus sonchifolius]
MLTDPWSLEDASPPLKQTLLFTNKQLIFDDIDKRAEQFMPNFYSHLKDKSTPPKKTSQFINTQLSSDKYDFIKLLGNSGPSSFVDGRPSSFVDRCPSSFVDRQPSPFVGELSPTNVPMLSLSNLPSLTGKSYSKEQHFMLQPLFTMKRLDHAKLMEYN